MKLVLASDNKKKLEEMKALLPGFELVTKSEAGFADEVEENGTTFLENSLIKSRAVFGATGLTSVADDSGLEVDCLGGRPGVYSKRFAGEDATDAEKIAYLLSEIEKTGEKTPAARFVSVVSCTAADGTEFSVRGECKGRIIFTPRGENGFGYDPVFVPDGFEQSFAELSAEDKNKISHRGRALRAFAQEFARRYGK